MPSCDHCIVQCQMLRLVLLLLSSLRCWLSWVECYGDSMWWSVSSFLIQRKKRTRCCPMQAPRKKFKFRGRVYSDSGKERKRKVRQGQATLGEPCRTVAFKASRLNCWLLGQSRQRLLTSPLAHTHFTVLPQVVPGLPRNNHHESTANSVNVRHCFSQQISGAHWELN